jgi:hypothetical protein
MISGWEWVGASSLNNDLFDIKVATMSDWPNQTRTLPMPPQENGLLVKLLFKLDVVFPVDEATKFDIKINPDNCGFSDPIGNSIGVKTRIERKCADYIGDSCVFWKNVRVGERDPLAIKLVNGSITVVDTTLIKE